MNYNQDMDFTCLQSTPNRNPFRVSPTGISSLENNNPFSPENNENVDENSSRGEEFINSLLNLSVESQNPFKAEINDNTTQASSGAKSATKFRKPVKLPDNYDGKSSLRDYLRHFNRCSVVNDWSSEESAVFLSAALRGQAQKILHGMSDDDCRDYNKLVARLELSFGVETQQELHQARLLNRHQLEGESLRSLAADIRDSCSLAYQDLPPSAIERFCVQHFIDAINDHDDRMRLRREKPRSLDEALATACELEAFRLLETSKRKAVNMRSITTENENKMANTSQVAQLDIQEKFDQLKQQQEKQFNNLCSQIQQLLQDNTKNNRSEAAFRPRRNLNGNREQVECWYCKEKGHLRRDCSLWKQKQENERKAPSNAQRSA